MIAGIYATYLLSEEIMWEYEDDQEDEENGVYSKQTSLPE